MKWYVIQVTAGRETEIRDALERTGIQACAPQELRLIRRRGKWTQKLYTLFPSYVFLRAHYDADTYYKIKSIDGVLHFVGPEGRPEPLSAFEAEYIRLLSHSGCPLPPSIAVQAQDGSLQLSSGILLRLHGQIEKLDRRRRRAKVKFSLLGEERYIELSFTLKGDGKDLFQFQ